MYYRTKNTIFTDKKSIEVKVIRRGRGGIRIFAAIGHSGVLILEVDTHTLELVQRQKDVNPLELDTHTLELVQRQKDVNPLELDTHTLELVQRQKDVNPLELAVQKANLANHTPSHLPHSTQTLRLGEVRGDWGGDFG